MKKQNSVFGRPLLPVLLVSLFGLAGCVSNQPKQEASAPDTTPVVAEKAAAPAAVTETKPVCPSTPPRASKKKEKNSKTKKEVARDCVPATNASAKAAAAPAATKAVSRGGYDLTKNTPVTDSSKVESGQGTTVTGLNEWQGEITGVPAANSRFTKLRIGMPQQQVVDLVGQPTDQGAYVTGKAFIPFYFGSDKTRWEMVYKGQGRLIFSNQAGFGSGHYLTWIIHNANEGGYR
jgi:hypothetical protein